VELKLNVSRVLLLDTPFKPSMLEDRQAVIGTIEGKYVLMVHVDVDEIEEQVRLQSNQ
jgi:hypothetical protein